MKILVLQHVDVEHPGIFRDFFKTDGLTWDTVELDAGETIPDVAVYDLMVVMGGPQDVWEEDKYPWLADEKAAIRRFVVDLGRPYLGICLGHQLLAAAVGGQVALGATPEVGILDVRKTDAGRADPIFKGIGNPIGVLQWHGAEVVSVPPGAVVLAESDACPVQAFRYGACAYGFQFHLEITNQTVADWAAIPVYARALEKALGIGAVARLEAEAADKLPIFNRNAGAIYDNFKAVMRENATKVSASGA
ncbi:MAG TPA: type 1 glutamine amidotransferase [Hyphomicrobium sp.]|jgi:GMP synthase-like glutamine amidotransferase|nr:type 1 glutamine amidotransferase [Hyphomicrobium sp.]